jgi:hypothetical protein
MNIFLIFGLVILWLTPGIVTAGFAFAFYQGRFKVIAAENYKHDRILMPLMAIFGPCNLVGYYIAGLITQEKHFSYGWRLK